MRWLFLLRAADVLVQPMLTLKDGLFVRSLDNHSISFFATAVMSSCLLGRRHSIECLSVSSAPVSKSMTRLRPPLFGPDVLRQRSLTESM